MKKMLMRTHAFLAVGMLLFGILFSPWQFNSSEVYAQPLPAPCTSLTVTVGSDVQTVEFTSLPATLTYAPNGRTLTISDLGGGKYKVVYDVTAGMIMTMRQLDATITLNGPATFTALDTSYALPNGIETFPGALGGDSVRLLQRLAWLSGQWEVHLIPSALR